MSPKKVGIVTGAALAGAGALCARHMKSQLHEASAKGCPCKPGDAADEDEQRRERAGSPQEVRDAA